ncbi:MAG: glycosyltransferase [Marinilabiliaceae bacterium]|nr:glycosyltransferase [Marinilabiliaceae bacterium]
MQPLLTVIVPCYNVEKQIDKSIDSIVNQTYTNLEILLINDGSCDNTGNICDLWQQRDNRIKVIHKQNEGLAFARKTGIENTTAQFVTFLDADDWIDLNMYSDLMNALLTTNSDIAQGGICYAHEDGQIVHSHNNTNNPKTYEIVDRIQGVLTILEDKNSNSSFGTKIYKKHLFNDIEFPKARGFAEDYISHYLFHKISQSVYIQYDYYYYLQRNDSIIRNKSLSAEMKKISDFSDAYCDRYSFTAKYPEYKEALPFVKYMTIYLGIHLLRNIIVRPKFFDKNYFYSKAKQIRNITVDKEHKIGRGILLEFKILKISPKLYKFLRKFFNFIIKITNQLKITNLTKCYTISELFEWAR